MTKKEQQLWLSILFAFLIVTSFMWIFKLRGSELTTNRVEISYSEWLKTNSVGITNRMWFSNGYATNIFIFSTDIEAQYIIATIIPVTTTNWITVSKTTPIIQNPRHAIHVTTTLNQIGLVRTNVVARIEWKGQVIDTVLEQGTPSGDQLNRSIPEENQLSLTVPAIGH